MNLLSERLKWAMDKKTQRDGIEVIAADVARAAKVSETSCSYWIAGSNGMSAGKARLVAAFLGINALWLETGEGSPEVSTSSTAPTAKPVTEPVNEQIAAVVQLMKQTDDRGMRNIRIAAENALDDYNAFRRRQESGPITEDELNLLRAFRNATQSTKEMLLDSAASAGIVDSIDQVAKNQQLKREA